jgi:hypothetical protein
MGAVGSQDESWNSIQSLHTSLAALHGPPPPHTGPCMHRSPDLHAQAPIRLLLIRPLLLASSLPLPLLAHSGDATACNTGPSATLLQFILNGQFVKVLQSPEVQALLGAHDLPDQIQGPSEYYAWVQGRARELAAEGLPAEQQEQRLHTLLLAAVACLYVFMQHNVSG